MKRKKIVFNTAEVDDQINAGHSNRLIFYSHRVRTYARGRPSSYSDGGEIFFFSFSFVLAKIEKDGKQRTKKKKNQRISIITSLQLRVRVYYPSPSRPVLFSSYLSILEGRKRRINRY